MTAAPGSITRPIDATIEASAEWELFEETAIRRLDTRPTETVRDLRDRALIATLNYSFARIRPALKMKVEDLRPRGASWTIGLHEEGGKEHSMPSYHVLAEAPHAYINAAVLASSTPPRPIRRNRGPSTIPAAVASPGSPGRASLPNW